MAPIPGEEPWFTFSIQSCAGFFCSILCRNEDTILTLKEKIQEKRKIPPDQFLLCWAGRQLEDERTVESYRLMSGNILHVIMLLRGGMFHPSSGRKDMVPSKPPFLSSSLRKEVEEEDDILDLISKLEDDLQ